MSILSPSIQSLLIQDPCQAKGWGKLKESLQLNLTSKSNSKGFIHHKSMRHSPSLKGRFYQNIFPTVKYFPVISNIVIVVLCSNRLRGARIYPDACCYGNKRHFTIPMKSIKIRKTNAGILSLGCSLSSWCLTKRLLFIPLNGKLQVSSLRKLQLLGLNCLLPEANDRLPE